MIDRYEQIGRQCAGTPDIVAFDVCGNIARQVQSNRILPEDPLDIRISRNTWSLQGFAATRIDPRLFDLQKTDNTIKPNVSTLNDLEGRCLRTDSIDAGLRTVMWDVAGQLTSIDLTQKDLSPVTVIGNICYEANGLRLSDKLGNGVTNTHSYDPSTLRLISSQTQRPEQEGRDPMLQDLYYDYDPVGNVIATYNYALHDSANDNAGMLGESTFHYDACYQMCLATGRENSSSQQGSSLPAPIVPVVTDPTLMSPYERSYRYDRAGNLLQVKHQGAVQFTQGLVVSDRSNRCVLQTATGIQPADVDAKFDRQGNPATLSTGAALAWDRYNRLVLVTTVTRTDGNPDDTESYLYDGNCQRVCKESKTLQSTESGSVNTVQTLYLPCLTVRRTLYGGTLNEDLHTLAISGSGDQDIRVLHWTAGQPADIGNDQYRYSVNNQIHANLIELDASADILTLEEYYPFGGTAVWSTRNATEAKYKFIRYSGKERDITGLYYYGFRYYIPWMARWTNPDPAGFSDGLNVYQMVHNDPATYFDPDGHSSVSYSASRNGFMMALVLQPAFFVREQSSASPGWQPDYSSTLPPPQNHLEMGDILARANEDPASPLQDVPPDTTHYEEIVANQSNPLPQSVIPPDDWTIPIAKSIGEYIARARTELFSQYDSHGGATYTEHMNFVSDLYLLFDKVAELTTEQPHRTRTIMSEALGMKGIKSPNDALAFISSARQNFVFIGEYYLKEPSDPASRLNMPDLKSVLGPHWISLDIFPGTDSSNCLRTYTIRGAQVRDTTA